MVAVFIYGFYSSGTQRISYARLEQVMLHVEEKHLYIHFEGGILLRERSKIKNVSDNYIFLGRVDKEKLRSAELSLTAFRTYIDTSCLIGIEIQVSRHSLGTYKYIVEDQRGIKRKGVPFLS